MILFVFVIIFVPLFIFLYLRFFLLFFFVQLIFFSSSSKLLGELLISLFTYLSHFLCNSWCCFFKFVKNFRVFFSVLEEFDFSSGRSLPS